LRGWWQWSPRKIVDPRAGIFGPRSISWRINRESALFLGAGRAALLQLAHPWVAAALAQHSSLMSNPIARFHNTFRIVFTMIFGSSAQAFAASRSLYQLHTRIRGELPSAVAGYARGSHYEANSLPALIWVYATLVESAVLAYECVLPALNDAEREAVLRREQGAGGVVRDSCGGAAGGLGFVQGLCCGDVRFGRAGRGSRAFAVNGARSC
jgi:uncharacterized protein (DUF2236 family)